jgi:translation initiation factor 2A
MPAKTTIFNTRAEATHSFALGPRNTILFSPHGRFVLVAGFGNLAGHTDIYDLEKDYQKVCTIEASNASVCEWSPDGRYILTATTSPRLRVDNGVKIWHVSGGLMYNEELQELYHVTWRPQSTTTHPLTANPLQPVPAPHASALAYLGTVKTPSKPTGAYRPPGARGTTTPLAFMREDQGGAAYVSNGSMSLGSGVNNGFGKPRRREVPGAEPVAEDAQPSPTTPGVEGDENLSKAALKNKKKREAKKAKDATDKAAGLTPVEGSGAPAPSRSPDRGDVNGREHHQRNRSRTNSELRPRSQQGRPRGHSQRRDGRDGPNFNNNNQRQVRSPGQAPNGAHNINIAAASNAPAPDLTVTSPGGGTPQEKKIRALTKKLRAIEDLKMRRAGGETLEGTQIKKMETEDSVRRELESLGWNE